MIDFIERTMYKDSLDAVFKNHYRRADSKKGLKTVYV